jgi:hypothetical protein
LETGAITDIDYSADGALKELHNSIRTQCAGRKEGQRTGDVREINVFEPVPVTAAVKSLPVSKKAGDVAYSGRARLSRHPARSLPAVLGGFHHHHGAASVQRGAGLLALLDDVPVMLIAFDNAKVSSRPSRWDMHRVLLISSVLALISVVQSVMLLRHVHYQADMTTASRQTAMFMQFVIAGHLLLFSTRSQGFFFQPPWPEWKFFCAIMATQVFAAFMAANGWLVTPISWGLIGYIWLFNVAWLVVLDFVKVALYHHYDTQKAGQASWQKWFHAPLNVYGGRLGNPPPTRGG